jgi:PhnB protein
MLKASIYLNFNGNTEEAFIFYKSVIGGEFTSLVRYKETPEAAKISDSEKEKIMHICLPINQHTMLMATDTLQSLGYTSKACNNFHISLHSESRDDADRLFNRLSHEGIIKMPMADTFWGDYFGMCTDKFGIQWMIAFTPAKN